MGEGDEPAVAASESCLLADKVVAQQRWKLLARALTGDKLIKTANSTVSVRRFSSFGLLDSELILGNVPSETSASWFNYTCPTVPPISVTVRHLTREVTPEALHGFNNTGNICVWPTEEVMAYYCLKHLDIFSGKNICELGGGMTCLAGIVVAACSDARCVVLTDGNQDSAKNLHHIVRFNRERKAFVDKEVHSRLLKWGERDHLDSLEKFDYILCSDCLFFEEGRLDLIQTINLLLKPGGEAIVFAPRRGNSFAEFLKLASHFFFCSVSERYDDTVWQQHLEMVSKGRSVYDESIHYPLLLLLQKPLSNNSN